MTVCIKYSLKELMIYFLQLGTTGLGRLVALVGYMHKNLVEKRRRISEEEYSNGAIGTKPAGCTVSHLPGQCTSLDCKCNNSRYCFCAAFFYNGAAAGHGIQIIWRASLDVNCFLWRWCCC